MGDYSAAFEANGSGVALFSLTDGYEARSEDPVRHVGFRTSRPGLEAAKKQLTASGIGYEEGDYTIAWSIYLPDPDGYITWQQGDMEPWRILAAAILVLGTGGWLARRWMARRVSVEELELQRRSAVELRKHRHPSDIDRYPGGIQCRPTRTSCVLVAGMKRTSGGGLLGREADDAVVGLGDLPSEVAEVVEVSGGSSLG